MSTKKQEHVHQNGQFANSLGFVMACVGSAVGMGNIWLFPYRLGQYGGAVFLIPYIIFIILFGMVGLSAEFAVGRRAKTGTLGAYEYCWSSRGKGTVGKVLGWIPLIGSLGIAIGYAVIIGWVLRSLLGGLTGELLTVDSSVFFANMSSAFGNIPCHVLVVVITCVLLIFGATKGIEKANKILMPAFFVLFVALAVGLFVEDGDKVGSWMDFITILVVPFGALLGAFSIYYILGWDEIRKELQLGRKCPVPEWFGLAAKYIYVPVAAIVLILGIVYGGIG